MSSLIRRLHEIEAEDEVLAASYLLGFPWADNPDIEASVHVVTKTSEQRAAELAGMLASEFWKKREEFVFVSEAYSLAPALEKAAEYVRLGQTPVYLSDSGDNPTAGGTSDNTQLLKFLLSHKEMRSCCKNPILYAGFYDPEAVKRCKGKIGDSVALSIGSRFDTRFGEAHITGVVKNYLKGFLYGGIPGDVAVLSADGIDIILSENHIGYTDPSLFRALGLDPEEAEIVICKLGYLTPGHAVLAKRSILVLTEGATNQDIESMPYRHIPKPVFPLNRDFTYLPEERTIR